MIEIATGKTTPLTGEGFVGLALSPDGTRVATVSPKGLVMSYPTAGGEGTPLQGFAPGDRPVQWNADGRSVFASRFQDRRLDFFKVSLDSGKRELWRSHAPQTAQSSIQRAIITPDGRASVIALSHAWHELYVVEGIR